MADVVQYSIDNSIHEQQTHGRPSGPSGGDDGGVFYVFVGDYNGGDNGACVRWKHLRTLQELAVRAATYEPDSYTWYADLFLTDFSDLFYLLPQTGQIRVNLKQQNHIYRT